MSCLLWKGLKNLNELFTFNHQLRMQKPTKLRTASRTDNFNRDHEKIAADLRALAFEKELPNALDLEEAVIGAAMLDLSLIHISEPTRPY